MLFNLPVAWPTLLGLRGRPKYLDSEIRAAVEEALALPVEEGYSPTAISGRVELIEGAADVMRSNGNMPPRDAFIQASIHVIEVLHVHRQQCGLIYMNRHLQIYLLEFSI